MEQVVNGDTDGKSTVSRHQMRLFLIRDVQDGGAELVPFRGGGIPHPLRVLRTPSPPSLECPTSKVVFDDRTELETFNQALAQSIHEVVMGAAEPTGSGQCATTCDQNPTDHQHPEPMLILNGRAKAHPWMAIQVRSPACW
jgi:hypothetical protein